MADIISQTKFFQTSSNFQTAIHSKIFIESACTNEHMTRDVIERKKDICVIIFLTEKLMMFIEKFVHCVRSFIFIPSKTPSSKLRCGTTTTTSERRSRRRLENQMDIT